MTADKIIQPCCLGKIMFRFMLNWQAILTIAIAREIGTPPDFEETIEEGLGREQRLLDVRCPCPLGRGIPDPSSLSSADAWLPSWFCKMPSPKTKDAKLWQPPSLFFLSLWNIFFQKMLSPFSRCLKIVISGNKRGRKIPVSVSKVFLLSFRWLEEVKCNLLIFINYANIINAVKTFTWNYA